MGRYVPNRGFERDLGGSLGMRNLQTHVASRVEGAARQSAPRGATGSYARSISSDVKLDDGVWHAVVGSDDFFWHGIEFGSVNNPAYATLRRALEKVVRRTKRTSR